MNTNNNQHSVAHFNPTEYQVIGLADNRPPQAMAYWCAGRFDEEGYKADRKAWDETMHELFGSHGVNPHRCVHCGQTNVFYVASVVHVPTGERLCFGWQCVDHLEFPGREAFDKARLEKRAAASRASMAAYRRAKAFIEEHDLQATVDAIAALPADDNAAAFPRDLVAKLFTYGYLTDGQLPWLARSLKQYQDRAGRLAERAAEDARVKATAPALKPGRCRVRATLVYSREQETDFGLTTKGLWKLDDGNKFWSTVPGDVAKDDKVDMSITLKLKDGDEHFAFGSRPYVHGVIAA